MTLALVLTAIIVCVIFFFLWTTKREEAERLKEQKENLEDVNATLSKQIARLQSEASIKQKNRKDADEKINNLHDGDALGNALNGLHKHKN